MPVHFYLFEEGKNKKRTKNRIQIIYTFFMRQKFDCQLIKNVFFRSINFTPHLSGENITHLWGISRFGVLECA
jgi:hypothetical protein